MATGTTLPMAAEDRMCYPRALENPLRRRFAPPSREVTLLDPRPGETVADLGAGVGYFDPEILRRIGAGGHLYAVDIDSENLALAQRRVGGAGQVEFRVGSAAQVPNIPSDSVDRVLLSLVICCMVDKEGALDEAWRILRPGGVALITYPKRRLLFRRRPSLRVVPERWTALQVRHPWVVRPVRSSWIVQRHLLQKLLTTGRPTDPAGRSRSIG